jgi:hypothetical protein
MRWGYNQPLDLNAIECVPVNRHFDQWKFELVLQGRSTPILYTAKETVKKIIPAKTYESIRRLFFRAAGRK